MSLSKKYEAILDRVAGLLLRNPPPLKVHVLIKSISSRRGFFQVALFDMNTGSVLDQGLISIFELMSFIRQGAYTDRPIVKAWESKQVPLVTTFTGGGSFLAFSDRIELLGHTHAGLQATLQQTEGIMDLAEALRFGPQGRMGFTLDLGQGNGVLTLGGGGGGGGSSTGPR